MENWKKIWINRKLDDFRASDEKDIILEKLIKTDGFDRGIGNIEVEAWKDYIRLISEKISLESDDSIFEVGCGCGAFLYPFYIDNHKVGGIDYSATLVKMAGALMAGSDFYVCDAIDLNTESKFDIVVANSVFFYFPDYEYSEKVLTKMILKSGRGVLVLDVPDLEKKEENEIVRRKLLPPGEYEKKYAGLSHLYFDKGWFKEYSDKNGFKLRIFQQNIVNYENSKFRFNCVIEK